ncbi:MAG: DUF3105 domain-containing protein [Candidatus Rokuibacteriota bacterium]
MGPAQGVPEGLSRKERRELREQQKEAERRRRQRGRFFKKGAVWGVAGLLVAAGAGWLGYSIATAKRLPPTGIADHVEQNPPTHILTTPMPLAIQKHMLEHADGGGRPGVVINYNCVKFRCPEGMADRLAGMVRAFPDFVYLAPYPEMDVRIAVTKLGKILTLDEPDLEKIRAFITE